MNREDIIRMAREAELYEDGQFFVCKHEELGRFAALVAAAEREACAGECDKWSKRDDDVGAFIGRAIRARSNT